MIFQIMFFFVASIFYLFIVPQPFMKFIDRCVHKRKRKKEKFEYSQEYLKKRYFWIVILLWGLWFVLSFRLLIHLYV